MSSVAGLDPIGALLVEVAGGNQDAVARLYDQLAPRVFGLARRVLVDVAQAEEVTQEAFVQVWREASRFDGTRGSGLSWVLMITHRRAVDRVRAEVAQSRRDVAYETLMSGREADSTVEQVLDREDARTVHVALSTLSQSQREAIELAYLSGLTHREVAERLDVPLGTVKTRIRDGMARLREQMRGTR